MTTHPHPHAAPVSAEKTYKYIDCDVHHILPNFGVLMDYIEPGLRRRIELASNSRAEARNNFQMPRRAYFNPTSTARVDTMDADGTNHASIPQRIKEDLLDRYDITYAVLMGNDLTTISGMPDPDLAGRHHPRLQRLDQRRLDRFRPTI